MNEWRNDDWRLELEGSYEDCYLRLCECRNTRKDLEIIASLMYQYNSDKTAEECVEKTLEWVGDWNGQFEVTDLTKDEYEKLIEKVLTSVL